MHFLPCLFIVFCLPARPPIEDWKSKKIIHTWNFKDKSRRVFIEGFDNRHMNGKICPDVKKVPSDRFCGSNWEINTQWTGLCPDKREIRKYWRDLNHIIVSRDSQCKNIWQKLARWITIDHSTPDGNSLLWWHRQQSILSGNPGCHNYSFLRAKNNLAAAVVTIFRLATCFTVTSKNQKWNQKVLVELSQFALDPHMPPGPNNTYITPPYIVKEGSGGLKVAHHLFPVWYVLES